VSSGLEIGAIVVGLLGGLALFLFGMDQMTGALKVVAGDRMRTILGKLTTNRFSAAATGAFVTAVIQSSSVTTVLVVGFISAGLMSLAASVGVIMGANVGTTITAQIVAFKVTEYALALIAVGFGLMFASKRERARQIGAIVMGLGLVFFGMGLMGEATHPLRSYEPFIQTMQNMSRPLVAILASAAFTALVQSSSATTGIVIVLASQGFITLEAGIALALGANIGTCVTAWLAALGKPRVAQRAAAIHVLFNVVGVLLWVGLIGLLADVVRSVSPAYPDLDAQARLAAETPRQIANAHTLFNVVNTLVFIPFTVQIARLAERLVPERARVVPERARPLHLGEVYLETPALALDRLRLEIGHLGEIVLDVLQAARRGPIERDRARISRGVRDVELLHAEILGYARKLSQAEMGSPDTQRLEDLLASSSHLQNISDTVGVNLGTMMHEWESRGFRASEETRAKFLALYDKVVGCVSLSVDAIRESDDVKAGRVVALKTEVGEDADRLGSHLAARLGSHEKDVAVYRMESGVIELLKRIYYFAKRIAKTVGRITEEPEE
jgi:phosphate:Na+ symporter